MTAPNLTLPAPGSAGAPAWKRTLPERSRLRRIWDRIGWNVLLFVEIVVLIVVLELAVNTFGLWNPNFVPPPSDIASAFGDLMDRRNLLHHISFSLGNFVVGFLLAVVVAIPVGLVMGTMTRARQVASPIVWMFYATPRVALAPLLVMWLGYGNASKVAVIFLMAVFPILISVWSGAESVDQTLLRAGRIFGARRLDLYRKVILPSIVPYTLTGLKLGVARGIIGVVIAEFIGSTAGIGYLISILSSEFLIAGAISLTLVLMVTAMVSMRLIDLIQRRVAPWYREDAA
jgi:NitT/TauT family transport system permease protein